MVVFINLARTTHQQFRLPVLIIFGKIMVKLCDQFMVWQLVMTYGAASIHSMFLGVLLIPSKLFAVPGTADLDTYLL